MAACVFDRNPDPMPDSCYRLSVLVVDDEPDTVSSTSELLTLHGHHVRVALTGREALLLAAADPPDVALLDIYMPGMDGCDLARRLAEEASAVGRRPLLVAVTGYAADIDRNRTTAAGFDLHLVKPVDPAVLVGLLRRFERALAPAAPCSGADGT